MSRHRSRLKCRLYKEGFEKDKAFIMIMIMLILLFLGGFIKNVHGNQGTVFFNRAGDYMADYYNVAKYSTSKNPYLDETNGSAEHTYPPLAYVFGYLWSKCADYINFSAMEAGRSNLGLATSAFFMFSVSAMFLLLIYDAVRKGKLQKCLISICMMMSGIFLFSYERGNIIFLAALCSSFFILNYKSENKVLSEFSYLLLAVSAALKGYPALLGILVIFDKNYKGAIRLIIYGILFMFLPFLFFEGGFANIPIMLKNMNLNSQSYAGRVFPRFNFRYWVSLIKDADLRGGMYSLAEKVNLLLCCGAVVLSWFQKIPWKRVMLLLSVIVLLPVNSAEYTGLYLMIGMVLFLNDSRKSSMDVIYLLLMVLILNPFQIIIKGHHVTLMAMNLSASVLLMILILDTCYGLWKGKKVIGTGSTNHGRLDGL